MLVAQLIDAHLETVEACAMPREVFANILGDRFEILGDPLRALDLASGLSFGRRRSVAADAADDVAEQGDDGQGDRARHPELRDIKYCEGHDDRGS